MCQLLGMNCASPTDFTFSLSGFCRRGGGTDKHAHGWGTVIYEGKGIRCFKDTQAACTSPMAQFMLNLPNPIRTYNMMAHIRYATVGEVTLENVHPFTRELWGVPFCFCHNGECPPFSHGKKSLPLLARTRKSDVAYQPIGDTDSEAVFCSLLNALRAEFPHEQPRLPVLFAFLSQLCLQISQLNDIAGENSPGGMPTIFNFLLGCGTHILFAYSWPGARPGSKVWNGLHYIIREPPFSTAQLIDDEDTGFIDFRKVTTPEDRVAVIATKPLTHESGWVEIQKGQLVLFEHGKAFWSAQDLVRHIIAKDSEPWLPGPVPAAVEDSLSMAISDGEEDFESDVLPSGITAMQ